MRDPESIARDVLRCALSHEPDARLIGDVTAAEAVALAAAQVMTCPACGSEAWVNIDCDTCLISEQVRALASDLDGHGGCAERLRALLPESESESESEPKPDCELCPVCRVESVLLAPEQPDPVATALAALGEAAVKWVANNGNAQSSGSLFVAARAYAEAAKHGSDAEEAGDSSCPMHGERTPE